MGFSVDRYVYQSSVNLGMLSVAWIIFFFYSGPVPFHKAESDVMKQEKGKHYAKEKVWMKSLKKTKKTPKRNNSYGPQLNACTHTHTFQCALL